MSSAVGATLAVAAEVQATSDASAGHQAALQSQYAAADRRIDPDHTPLDYPGSGRAVGGGW